MPARRLLAPIFLALACATPPVGGPLEPPHDPAAEAIVRAWADASQGGDALEAWELIHGEAVTRFGLARRWGGARVEVLTWVIAPADAAIRAFMLRVSPGWKTELQWAVASRYSGRRLEVRRSGAPPSNPARFDALSVGAEVAVPMFPEDFGHVRLADVSLGGEACRVIESRPRRRLRAYTHVRRCIAREPPQALRTTYFRGDDELRRIDLEPHTDDAPGPRYRVHTADGETGLLVRRNAILDASPPASLFSELTLEAQRFPSF